MSTSLKRILAIIAMVLSFVLGLASGAGCQMLNLGELFSPSATVQDVANEKPATNPADAGR